MDKSARRAAVAAYKEQKKTPGIFAVRCAASGDVWVGAAPDADNRQNGLWFSLRLGSSPFRSLQAAWTAYGEDAFSFEVLERLTSEDVTDYERRNWMKLQTAQWCEQLDATAI